MEEGREPIAADEFIYRRVSVNSGWYDPVTRSLEPEAFAPRKQTDETGLSVVRAKYKSIEDAAKGAEGKKYYVAVLKAEDICNLGIPIEPKPDLDTGFDPAHAEFPTLNAANRKAEATIQAMEKLAANCLRVEGPF